MSSMTLMTSMIPITSMTMMTGDFGDFDDFDDFVTLMTLTTLMTLVTLNTLWLWTNCRIFNYKFSDPNFCLVQKWSLVNVLKYFKPKNRVWGFTGRTVWSFLLKSENVQFCNEIWNLSKQSLFGPFDTDKPYFSHRFWIVLGHQVVYRVKVARRTPTVKLSLTHLCVWQKTRQKLIT